MQSIRKEPFQISEKPTDEPINLSTPTENKYFNIEIIFYHTIQKNSSP